jgi:hypothetical protein
LSGAGPVSWAASVRASVRATQRVETRATDPNVVVVKIIQPSA